ncbi:MAG: DNA-directed RNA polymerase subunit N [Euryarchaeota archaeon]|nr:DNA-directed RNA polymerase subunit N [Euryarchaeota archaeon]
MIIPIRCFSCGTVIAHKWEEYQELVSSGVEQADAMDQVGLERYCCRRMYVAHIDLLEDVAVYSAPRA